MPSGTGLARTIPSNAAAEAPCPGVRQTRGVASDVGVQLDAWMEGLLPSLSPLEQNVLFRWQGRDRYYAKVQRHLRGVPSPDPLVTEDADVLTSLLVRGDLGLPFAVDVWRGIRSGARMFTHMPPAVGSRITNDGVFATTIYREVAEAEFLVPPGEGGPVLFSMTVPAGTPAVWMPVAGDPVEAAQGELLLTNGLEVTLRDVQVIDSVSRVALEMVT